MLIRARAPLRLGLAGGGTDIASYADVHGGYVLNATIDRYAYAVLRTLDEPQVRLVATDKQLAETTPLSAELAFDDGLDLHKAVYNEIVRTYNGGRPLAIELSTFCDAPAGSGLGSSSTLVVAMVKAFVELLNLPLDDYTIARLAYKVERVDCGLQGGQQDQYSATFGGFNFMEFYEGDHVVINPLRVKNWIICELEASLLLYYTGVSRESARIIADQVSGIEAGTAQMMEAMHGLKRGAVTMKECLLRGDFGGIVESMRAGWESKKRSAATVSTPMIEERYEAAMDAGALAGKVSGAGGGGFIMFFVHPDHRMDVIRALRRFGGELSNCNFTKNGTQAWRL
ncbi:MAG TPA: dehydrogenase [Usitatibacter sp.]|nr:dehydrogenase [Usitatibacter sp.]